MADDPVMKHLSTYRIANLPDEELTYFERWVKEYLDEEGFEDTKAEVGRMKAHGRRKRTSALPGRRK